MTTLEIVQPIATIHDTLGCMQAIRAAVLTVDATAVMLKEKATAMPILYTSIVALHIAKIQKVEVKQISLIDFSQDVALRDMLWRKGTTLCGTAIAAAIMADGTAITPDIYQYVGGLKADALCRYNVADTQKYYLDYKGTLYTAEQLKKKMPQLQDIITGKSIDAIIWDYAVNDNLTNVMGVGNKASIDIATVVQIPHLARLNERLQLAANTAATTLMSNYVNVQTSSSTVTPYLAQTGTFTFKIDNIPVYTIPAGYTSVLIGVYSWEKACIQQLNLPAGVFVLNVTLHQIPRIYSQTYMSCLRLVGKRWPVMQQLLKMASIPGSRRPAELELLLGDEVEYVDTTFDWSKDIYDLATQIIRLDEQPARILCLAGAEKQNINLVVSKPFFKLYLQKAYTKYLPALTTVHGASRIIQEFVIHYTCASDMQIDISNVVYNRFSLVCRAKKKSVTGSRLYMRLPGEKGKRTRGIILTDATLEDNYTSAESVYSIVYIAYRKLQPAEARAAIPLQAAHFMIYVKELTLVLAAEDLENVTPKHVYMHAGVESIHVYVRDDSSLTHKWSGENFYNAVKQELNREYILHAANMLSTEVYVKVDVMHLTRFEDDTLTCSKCALKLDGGFTWNIQAT